MHSVHDHLAFHKPSWAHWEAKVENILLLHYPWEAKGEILPVWGMWKRVFWGHLRWNNHLDAENTPEICVFTFWIVIPFYFCGIRSVWEKCLLSLFSNRERISTCRIRLASPRDCGWFTPLNCEGITVNWSIYPLPNVLTRWVCAFWPACCSQRQGLTYHCNTSGTLTSQLTWGHIVVGLVLHWQDTLRSCQVVYVGNRVTSIL